MSRGILPSIQNVFNYYSDRLLANCILWGNTAIQGDSIYLALYSWAGIYTTALTISYSDVEGGYAGVYVETGCTLNWGEGNIDADPLFADSVAGDYHLSVGSPCIDAGDPAYIPSLGETDIDGEPRVMGGRVDMGIDEFTSTLTPILRISPIELRFSTYVDGPNPDAQTLFIQNIGAGILNWEIAEDCPWLQIYPANGVSIGQVNEVTLSVDISGLTPGSYNCQLTIAAESAVNSPQTVAVTLNLGGSELYVPLEYDTIQAAIDAAIRWDTVIVAKGTYTGPGNRDIDFGGKAITVRSIDPNDPNTVAVTIIDCNGTEDEPHRGFYFHSGEDCNSVVAGFTITNGYASSGGGVYSNRCSPMLTNCIFRGNSADYVGGGMYNRSGSSPILVNCIFSGNSARVDGGGMHNGRNSNPTLINCTFSHNNSTDGFGGGMSNSDSSPMLVNCIFSSNSTVWSGGGMANYYSSPTLTNCTFSGNSACYGGGMCNWDASPTLANCTFSDNRVTRYCSWLCLGGQGGGMDNNGHSSPMLTNCTFSGNSAYHGGGMSNYDNSTAMLTNCRFTGNLGGAIYNWGYLNQITLTLDNCTFAGNSALNGNALACDSSRQRWPSNVELNNCILRNGGNKIWNNDGSTVGITYSDVQGGQTEVYDPCEGLVWGLGNIDADPCFADPGYWDANGVWVDGDYYLLPGSPCINAGDPNYVPEPNETDLDGKPRIIGGRIDMGAYEYSPPVPAEVRIVPRTINLTSRGKWITCYIWLSEDYDVADIDPNSVLLEGEIEAVSFRVDEQQQVAIIRFSRSEVQGILAPGEVELTVSGELTDGTRFEGADTIRVIDKGEKK